MRKAKSNIIPKLMPKAFDPGDIIPNAYTLMERNLGRWVLLPALGASSHAKNVGKELGLTSEFATDSNGTVYGKFIGVADTADDTGSAIKSEIKV